MGLKKACVPACRYECVLKLKLNNVKLALYVHVFELHLNPPFVPAHSSSRLFY